MEPVKTSSMKLSRDSFSVERTKSGGRREGGGLFKPLFPICIYGIYWKSLNWGKCTHVKLCNPSLSPANVLAHPCCNHGDDDHHNDDDDGGDDDHHTDDDDGDDDHNDCQCTCTPPLLQYSLKMLLQLVKHSVNLNPTLDCSIFPAAIFSENASATSGALCPLKKTRIRLFNLCQRN